MHSRNAIFFISAAILTLLLFAADIAFGSVGLSIGDIVASFTGTGTPEATVIVTRFRLPKAVVALLAGAALGASGLQMQTLFRNPLAGPYVLGISSGASLGVALFLMGAPLLGVAGLGMNLGIVGAAWLGAALVFALIVSVSRKINDIMVILILGVMFGSVASAAVEIMQYFSSEGAVKAFVVWTMGSLGSVTVSQLQIMAAAIFVGLVLAVLSIKSLNALMLGENYARTMGVDISRSRTLVLVSTTLLAGTVTAFCGPVSFLGLAVPHIVRMITGQADHRILMPGSMLVGAGVMLLCDIAAQLPLHNVTLPINTVTALVGVPIIIAVIIRGRRTF